MSRFVGLPLIMLALLWTTSPLLGGAAPSALTASEFKWKPKDVTVAPGEVTFAVTNKGTIEHNFVIEDAKGKVLKQVDGIQPGKTVQVKVALKAGKYTIACTVPGHREAGMVGTLIVK